MRHIDQYWVQNVLHRGDDLRAIPAKDLKAAKRLATKLAKQTQWMHVVITLLPNGETPTVFETWRI